MKQPLLFFSTGYFIYIGRAIDTVVHEHHAIQIAISLEDEIEVISSGSVLKNKAVIINSDEPHECRTYNNEFLLINIDPECKIGAGLKKNYLSGKKITILPETIIDELLIGIKPLLEENTSADSIFNIILQFLQKLSDTDGNKRMDERIVRVLEVLKQPGHEPLKIESLSALAYLSPSRLIHLFTEQVGIPVRKYILWTRLLTALQYIIDGCNITDAALEAGFSDTPHFNRTFKRMFGQAPTLLLQNSRIIQAYIK
ncbi:AraC-type DNA-binding protein [Chryseobacterium rhizoplanae]|uniref:AraC-type DNA-binding protein n=1 Tax=Chryseobacterium rhizoplanae TaxID=1609531 RepID=A0A521AM47_9FLAO|nr:AraC family transcriptional regulator [Chryseobacterium rhizoplanae]SMO35873.1 AraC-type DNA-binding protein [Chryseobacterium rhizoplanae]